MKERRLMKLFTLLIVGMISVGVTAYANDIKARMKKRLPVIIELKTKGIVGENNKGYLEFVGEKKENEDIVAAENQDRQTVYKEIAKQQGTTAELVGKRRALQIANKANKGEWVQDAGGQWQKK